MLAITTITSTTPSIYSSFVCLKTCVDNKIVFLRGSPFHFQITLTIRKFPIHGVHGILVLEEGEPTDMGQV